MLIKGKESRTDWMNPDSFVRKYKRVKLSVNFFLWTGVIAIILFSLFCFPRMQYIIAFNFVVSAIMGLPIAVLLSLVYKTSQILDVDHDARRYVDTLEEAKKLACWFQMGWINTERARAQIALGNYDEARNIINSNDLQRGMSKFYVSRKVELLGICALYEGDEETFTAYEKQLEELEYAPKKCGLGDNNVLNIIRIRQNWQKLKSQLATA